MSAASLDRKNYILAPSTVHSWKEVSLGPSIPTPDFLYTRYVVLEAHIVLYLDIQSRKNYFHFYEITLG